MVSAGATALFMTPEPQYVLVPQQSPDAEPCHDMITSTMIPRQRLLEEAFGSNSEMMRGARLVPSVRNGELVGLKVFAIRADSIYESVGLENGDTIHSVSGVDVMAPNSDRLLLPKLLRAESLEVEISRRGCARTLNVGLI
jgi:general secretion pathway protein C